MADYVEVEAARALPGLRLVLTAGVPGPWGEAAKALFHAKGLAFARVAQRPGESNAELVAWTGHDNAPVAVYADERPRAHWTELIGLAERLAPEPRLVPREPAQRAEMFGWIHELAGEDGLGWSRRLCLLHQVLALPLPSEHPARQGAAALGRKYGYSPEAAAAAPARAAEILGLFSERIRSQRRRGSRFLLGRSLSALDLYWAAFAAMIRPLPAELCPMSEGMRQTYTAEEPLLLEACDPLLLEHRDEIYRDWMELPVDL